MLAPALLKILPNSAFLEIKMYALCANMILVKPLDELRKD